MKLKKSHLRGILPPLLMLLGLLAGCAPRESTQTLFAMDTLMALTAYGAEGPAALDSAVARINRLEGLLSVTRPESDVYTANHAGGAAVPIARETAQLLEEALALCGRTGGLLDITVYPAVEAWGFTLDAPRVPTGAELAALVPRIDYTAVALEGQTLTLPEGVEIDLGAVAKGYCGDQVTALLRQHGVTSALLELGGSVHALGSKPGGAAWRVGVRDPAQAGDVLGVMEVRDRAVVTSGGYERVFEQDGQLYWHILDPRTATPARSGLVSVTVVGESGLLCDALSTALFVMGREAALAHYEEYRDFEAVLVSQDGLVTVTPGLAGSFTLLETGPYRLEVAP